MSTYPCLDICRSCWTATSTHLLTSPSMHHTRYHPEPTARNHKKPNPTDDPPHSTIRASSEYNKLSEAFSIMPVPWTSPFLPRFLHWHRSRQLPPSTPTAKSDSCSIILRRIQMQRFDIVHPKCVSTRTRTRHTFQKKAHEAEQQDIFSSAEFRRKVSQSALTAQYSSSP